MLGSVCFPRPTEDFDFALIYQSRFEWLFQKNQKSEADCLDKLAIINKIIKDREYIR